MYIILSQHSRKVLHTPVDDGSKDTMAALTLTPEFAVATMNGQYGNWLLGIEFCRDSDGTYHAVRRPVRQETFVGYGLTSDAAAVAVAITRISHDGDMTEWRSTSGRPPEWDNLAPCVKPLTPPFLSLPSDEHGDTWGDPVDIKSKITDHFSIGDDREISAAEAATCLANYKRSVRRSSILTTLSSLDDGTGNLGVIVDLALSEDPDVTVDEVREFAVIVCASRVSDPK